MTEEKNSPITRVGEMIGGYRVGKTLGAGAVGVVVEAVPLGVTAPVALKVMPPRGESSGEMVRLTLQAASLLAGARHKNVCTVLASGYHNDGRSFVAMELLQGVSLKERLKKRQILSEAEAMEIASQVLSGLHVVHQIGIIHRDIKPANIYLVKDETGKEQAKIVDFGIAFVQNQKSSSQDGKRPGAIYGTATYASPEQIRGLLPDARTDIYAVGVLLFRMLTGQIPFRNPSPEALYKAHLSQAPPKPRTLVPEISPFLEALVLKALNKKPEARFRSASEFLEALQAVKSAEKDRLKNAKEVLSKEPPKPVVVTKKTPPLWAVGLLSGLIGGAVFAGVTLSFKPVRSSDSIENPSVVTRVDLLIESTPGARVIRQGVSLGETPLQIKAQSGEWLVLQKEGYRDLAFQVSENKTEFFTLFSIQERSSE